jgi:ABC-2 type transport system permease protein
MMKFFPFYYVSYLPTLAVDGQERACGSPGVAVLTVWNLFFAELNRVHLEKVEGEI